MSFDTVPWAWKVEGITPTQKLVLMGLASYADERNSCYPGQELLASRAGVSDRTVRRALDELEHIGLIRRERRKDARGFRTSDRYFLHVTKNQPDKLSGSESYRTSTTELPDIDDRVTGHPCPSNYPEELPEEQSSSSAVAADGLFLWEDFWEAYPRKVGKQSALKAWRKAAKTTTPANLLAGAIRFAKDPNLPEKQFIPHPATWLNAGRWDDEPLPGRKPEQQQHANADWDWMTR